MLYRALHQRLERIKSTQAFDIGTATSRDIPSFTDRLVTFTDFLPADSLSSLKLEALRCYAPERSLVPTHKKGGTVAYETLLAEAPQIVSFYHSIALRRFISRIVGVGGVIPTPIQDQSSLSLLIYDRPGDHIGWHYDHNFYRGRHFTVLLALENCGRADGGLSHSVLKARVGGREAAVRTVPNTIVLFEGAVLLHKVTPILEGERRVILSMTYCTNSGASLGQGVARRLKDTAFFGPRALWT